MEHPRRNVEEALLDWHLERLEEGERARIEAEVRGDPGLRAKHERLGRVLQPLDSYRAAATPANLADKVLARVAQANPEGATRGLWSGQVIRLGRGSPFGMRELIAAAACIVLLVAAAVPGLAGVRERAHRAVCAANLGSVFLGTSAYQESFAGALPFAGSSLGASWLPVGDGPSSSNSRHTYLLLRLKLGPKTKDFLCPGSSDGEALVPEGLEARDDFATARNVSYDSLNMAGAEPNLRPPVSLAYMSDANPLFVGARFNERVDADRTNSPAHRGRGQIVLRLEGSARFETTPIYGRTGDNLWTIGNVRRYRGTECATRPDDAFLVPGFPATDARKPATR